MPRALTPSSFTSVIASPLAFVMFVALVLSTSATCSAPRPSSTPADSTAAFTFRRGVNVNHWLAGDYDETHRYGAPWFDAEDLHWIAAQGFDHVRLRTSGQEWARPDGSLDEAKLAPFVGALRQARGLGLGVVLTMTRFPGVPVPEQGIAAELPAAHRDAIVALWRSVAARFAAEDDALRFELMHGPHVRDPRQLADVQARALAVIRASSATRFVYFSVDRMSFAAARAATAAGASPLPADPRVGLALMYREPEVFTFQVRAELPLVSYPGLAPDFSAAVPEGDPLRAASHRPLTTAALDDDFAGFAAWIDRHAAGREIYVAQFGVYHRADDDSARRYVRAIHAALQRHRLSWAIYDYSSGCAVRGEDGAPTRILEALALRGAHHEVRYTWLDAGKTVGHGSLRRAGATIDAAYQLYDGSAGAELELELELDGRQLPRRYLARPPVPAVPVAAPAPAASPPAAAPVDAAIATPVPRETFTLDGATARWTTPVDTGSTQLAAPAYYIPFEDDPFLAALLARAILAAPSRRLPLFPSGEATLEELATHSLPTSASASGSASASSSASFPSARRLTAYAIVGLRLEPIPVWLDEQHQLFASLRRGYGPIAAGHAALAPALEAAATAALDRRAERAAAAVIHQPEVGLLFRDARVFDPIALKVTPHTSVLVLGDKITAVAPDGQLATPAGVDVIDARGRFLMPGLWDSHAHLFGRARAILHLAAGVTTVRDLGNETDIHTFVRRADEGRELSPRALLALRFGWEPGPGPATVSQVHSADDARRLAADAAGRGYVQLKALDDVDPRWVPAIAEAAHARGLRLSGHVPAKMTARQFLEAGADEIQHAPSLLRTAPPPAPGPSAPPPAPGPPAAPRPRLAPAITPAVRALLSDMARRGATLDPTLARFEPPAEGSALSPVAAELVHRLPPAELRAQQRSAPDDARRNRWAQLSIVCLELVGLAYRAGVTLVPGTDEMLAGFLLRRELDLYVRAGIPPMQVLRMATYGAARNMRRERTSGAIAAGMDADLLLIDGDPTQRIADLGNLDLVVQRGRRLLPAELLALVSLGSPPDPELH